MSGCIVNIDDIRVHENPDGSVDRTKSDMFMHLVDQKNNSVLEVHQVLQLLDTHVEKLDRLFKVSWRWRGEIYNAYNAFGFRN